MRDRNEINFTGRLGGDPALRYTPSGAPVCDFNVAVGNQYTDKDGNKVDQVTWFKCIAWNKAAEVYQQYLHKGSRVFISGQLKGDEKGNPRIWEGTDGVSHASFEVTVRELVFLDSKNSSSGNETSQMDTAPVVESDDIPF